MKKILSILLIAMLSVSLTACGGGEEKQDAANNDAVQQQEVQQDEVQKEEVELSPWLKTKTGQFYSQFKDGKMTMVYETAYEDSVMKTINVTNNGKTYSETIMDGQSVGANILDGGYMYNIDHSNKMIIKMAVETDTQELVGVLMEEGDVDPTAVISGTYTIDGKSYESEEWNFDGTRSILCFDGDDLAYIVAVYDGEEMTVKVLEYSNEADDSLFELPSDYEVMEL